VLFPARVSLERDAIVYEHRHWLVLTKEIVTYSQVVAVRVMTGPILGSVVVERSGGEAFAVRLFSRECRTMANEIRLRLP
jgi:hypothetical protein